MPRLIAVPVLAAALACGPSRLTRREAERDIRKDYPVVVAVRIPASAQVAKGSSEHTRLAALQDALTRAGWFSVVRAENGDQAEFRFMANPKAPRAVKAVPGGFELRAAEAEFVRILPGLATTPGSARVSYLIRLVRPQEGFPVFQRLHPGVKLYETKERHATYRKEGQDWVLQGTDESFKKAD